MHYFSTFQETTFQGGTIDGANYANFKSMFVCLYFEFCILYFQSGTRDDANDANFKSILRNSGQKRLRGNLPAVMQPVFQPSCNHVDGNDENVENFKELKCCKCSTGGQRLQTAGGAFRLVQDSKLALEQIPFGGRATILQIIQRKSKSQVILLFSV